MTDHERTLDGNGEDGYAETLAAQRAHANDQRFMAWLGGRVEASASKPPSEVLLYQDAVRKYPELAE